MTPTIQHLQPWHEDHSFGQDTKRPGEVRTLIVIALTATMMVVEILAGIVFHSMALLADGLHMASHAAALSIAAVAYVFARRYAHDQRFSFGTGKVNALGGFTGALLLGLFALVMTWESVQRLIRPEAILFDQAIVVAVLGLIVNGASVFILGHTHANDDQEAGCQRRDPASGLAHDHDDHRHDHNLRAAYFHVLADALTSVLAIFALLAGKYYGLIWMDPAMGIVGAILVARWSLGLLQPTGQVLLDRQAPEETRQAIRESIERDAENQVVDLHVWSIGPQIFAAEIVVLSANPQPPHEYKKRLPTGLGLAHVMVEVHREGEQVLLESPAATSSRDASQKAS